MKALDRPGAGRACARGRSIFGLVLALLAGAAGLEAQSVELPVFPESRELGGPGVDALSVSRGAGVGLAPTLGDLRDEEVSPGRIFLRSLAIPGWGHAVVGSDTRAAFYTAAQTGTVLMVLKSASRQRSADRFRRTEQRRVENELRLQGIQSPDSLRVLAQADPRVLERQELVDTRGQQVEDWVALGLFITLLGAADAFVAAHLADFPEALSLDVMRRPSDRGWDVMFRLPVRGPGG